MKWKLLLLWLWYIAWNLISSAYNKKSGKKYRKDLKENENTFKFALDNFLETQKNLFEDIKTEVSSEKNKEIYKKYKTQILEVFDDYKQKSEKLLEDLKENGEWYVSELTKKLKKLYEENKDKIDDFTDLSKEKTEELKSKLTTSFEKTKEEFKKLKKEK